MNKKFRFSKVIVMIGIEATASIMLSIPTIFSSILTLVFFAVIFICPKKISYIVILAAFGLFLSLIMGSIMDSRFNDESELFFIIFILLTIILITRIIIDFFDKRREKLLSNHNNK